MRQQIPLHYRSYFKTILICTALVLVSWTAADESDLPEYPSCTYCGMDRAKFAHSRVYITYSDGSTAGLCSLHCGAVELALKIDKTPSEIQVGDYGSHELIDAESALWVIGGELSGVMTRRAKWAFADKAGAEEFIAEHGGELADFGESLKATFEDMYEDLEMIRNKRARMKAKGGAQ